MDMTRRGIMKALAAVGSVASSGGAALGGAALNVAAASSATLGAGASQVQGYVGGMAGGFGDYGPVGMARRWLFRRAYPNTDRNDTHIRPSVACFRSASAVSKARWEIEERDRDDEKRALYEKAIQMINDGRITL